MAETPEQEILLNASQCAAQMGMSVRALRLYEQNGLIRPRRTQKQWRLYGSSEVARLHEMQMLKHFGLRLSDMAKIFEQQTTDVGRTLALQEDLLTEQLSQAEQGLMLIGGLRRRLEAGEELAIRDLLKLAKETKMSKPSAEAIAWRRYEQMRPRTEVEIDRTVLHDYVAAFQFDDGTYYFITAKDGRLFTRVAAQIDLEIVPESQTAFFMRDLPVQVTFIRGADQQVNALVHHQHGLEIRAARVQEESALAAEAEIVARVANRIPSAEGEKYLRSIIAGLQIGSPDYGMMAPALAELTRAQLGGIQASLAKAGSLVSLEFKGVGAAGWNVYDAQFENARKEWRILLAPKASLPGFSFEICPRCLSPPISITSFWEGAGNDLSGHHPFGRMYNHAAVLRLAYSEFERSD